MQNDTHKTTQKSFLYPQESYLIRGACFTIYKKFRNSQKEAIYQKALALELRNSRLSVELEKRIPIYYLNEKLGTYVPDIIVNSQIIIELKAKPFLHENDVKQFWYYLKNSEFKLGFLVNFGEVDGVKIIRKVYDTARKRSSA